MAVNNAWEGEADHDALLFAWIFGGSQRQPHASPPEHHLLRSRSINLKRVAERPQAVKAIMAFG